MTERLFHLVTKEGTTLPISSRSAAFQMWSSRHTDRMSMDSHIQPEPSVTREAVEGNTGHMSGSAAPEEFILSEVTNRLPDPPPCGRAVPACTVEE